MLNFSPRSRDTLTREFLIREEIAHAKAAKAAKPRQECGAGSDAGRGRDGKNDRSGWGCRWVDGLARRIRVDL